MDVKYHGFCPTELPPIHPAIGLRLWQISLSLTPFFACHGDACWLAPCPQGYFLNASGKELFFRRWMPASGKVKGVVFICHGYGGMCWYTGEGEGDDMCHSVKVMGRWIDEVTSSDASLPSEGSWRRMVVWLWRHALGGCTASTAVHGVWGGGIPRTDEATDVT